MSERGRSGRSREAIAIAQGERGAQPDQFSRVTRVERYALALLLSSLAACFESDAVTSSTAAKNAKPAFAGHTRTEEGSMGRPTEIGIEPTALGYDERTGEVTFNIWSFIAPVQLELGYEKETQGVMNVALPYELSRLFDTAKPLNPDDFEKIKAYIQEQLRTKFAEALIGLDSSKEAHVFNEGGKQPEMGEMAVDRMEITGLASPEGPTVRRGDGSVSKQSIETIRPGSKEPENEKLARLRGLHAVEPILAALQEMGIETAHVKTQLEQSGVKAEELQFTTDELRELAVLAKSYVADTGDDLHNIILLIIDYNEKMFEDPALADDAEIQKIKAALDRVVAAKRGVTVEIEYHGNQKKKVLIPIPVLLIIPLLGSALWALRRRQERRENQERVHGRLGTPGRGGNPPRAEGPARAFPRQRAPRPAGQFWVVPGEVRSTRLPAEDTRDYEIIEENTVLNDIAAHFGSSTEELRGIGYEGWTNTIHSDWDRFTSEDDRETAWAARILEVWQAADEAVIAQRTGNEDINLHYAQDPEKIRYARMHARELIRLARTRRESENAGQRADYDDMLNDRIVSLTRRRAIRQALEEKERK